MAFSAGRRSPSSGIACDPSNLCEDCGTRFGYFTCDESWCCGYGSDYQQDAVDPTMVKPHHTGRRCEDCLKKSESFCGVCKEFLCYVCTEKNARTLRNGHNSIDYYESREMETCSHCQQRVCCHPDYGCYYVCKRYGPYVPGSSQEVIHKVVCCEDCLKQPGIGKKWTHCMACVDLECTFFMNDAFCPQCKPDCFHRRTGEAKIVSFAEEYEEQERRCREKAMQSTNGWLRPEYS